MRNEVPRVTTGAHWVQVILSRLGYYTMNIDSKYVQGTDDAVRTFQRAYTQLRLKQFILHPSFPPCLCQVISPYLQVRFRSPFAAGQKIRM